MKKMIVVFIMSLILLGGAEASEKRTQISIGKMEPSAQKEVRPGTIRTLMMQMRQTKDKEARSILVNQIKEIRKNSLRLKEIGVNPDICIQTTADKLQIHKPVSLLPKQASILLDKESSVTANEVYRVPFASSGNRIELSVANSTSTSFSNVTVAASGIPNWVHFRLEKQSLEMLKIKSEKTVVFEFSLDKTASVGTNQNLVFNISIPSGQSWKKTITVQVDPPEQFELFQNFPNPFNPSTTISYQLSQAARVSLKIFNILGQEITTLIDNDKSAGYYEETWNADVVASGVYVYQLTARDQQGNRVVERKKMMVIK